MNSDSDDDHSRTDDDGDELMNEADKFVKEQIVQTKKEPKQIRFKFTHDTTDKDIFLLSHKRAIRIAIKHAENVDIDLPPNLSVKQPQTMFINSSFLNVTNSSLNMNGKNSNSVAVF